MNEYAVFELYVEQLWSFPLKNVCLEMPKRAQSKLYSDLFVFYLIFFFLWGKWHQFCNSDFILTYLIHVGVVQRNMTCTTGSDPGLTILPSSSRDQVNISHCPSEHWINKITYHFCFLQMCAESVRSYQTSLNNEACVVFALHM